MRFARRPVAAVTGAAAAALLASGVAAATLAGTAQATPAAQAGCLGGRVIGQLVRIGAVLQHAGLRDPTWGSDVRHRAKGVRHGLHPGRRRLLLALLGRHRPGVIRHAGGSVINEVRSDGGDVIVSAGGYNGTKLGQVCSSAAATAAAYQQVITTYGLQPSTSTWKSRRSRTRRRSPTRWARRRSCRARIRACSSRSRCRPPRREPTTSASCCSTRPRASVSPRTITRSCRSTVASWRSSQVTALQDFHSQLISTFGWTSAPGVRARGLSGMNGRTDSARVFLPE